MYRKILIAILMAQSFAGLAMAQDRANRGLYEDLTTRGEPPLKPGSVRVRAKSNATDTNSANREGMSPWVRAQRSRQCVHLPRSSAS
jgi:hypothetical protein